MERYVLALEIDDVSLQALQADGASIAVAKGSGSIISPTVVWLAWAPSGRDTITWDESYGLYAARGVGEAGSITRVHAAVYPAKERTVYAFRETGFDPPASEHAIPPGHFEIRNASQHALTTGILQSATVNGQAIRSPVNAVVVPPTFTADFSPGNIVFVWTHANLASGMLVQAPPDATMIPFTRRDRSKTYVYDGRTERFSLRS